MDKVQQKTDLAKIPQKDLNCKIQFKAFEGGIAPAVHSFEMDKPISSASLSVGQEFSIHCEGEDLKLIPSKFEIQWPKKVDSTVKNFSLVDTELISSNSSSIEIKAKSYLGQKQKLNFYIVGDESGSDLAVKNLELNLISVKAQLPKGGYFDPNDTQLAEEAEEQGLGNVLQSAKPQAFPSVGKVKMAYPIYFWVAIGFVLLGMILSAFTAWKIQKKKRDLKKRWEESKSPIGSHKDFHKSLRVKERSWYSDEMNSKQFLSELYIEIRLFFFREYVLSDMKSGHKHIIEYFSKNKRTASSRLNRLGILLDGINNYSKKEGEVKTEDVKDYLKRSRELVDHLYLKGGL